MVHNGVIQLHHGIHPFPLEYAPPVAKAANSSKASFTTAPGPKDAIVDISILRLFFTDTITQAPRDGSEHRRQGHL